MAQNTEALKWIRAQFSAGVDILTITNLLTQNGYTKSQIAELIAEVETNTLKSAKKRSMPVGILVPLFAFALGFGACYAYLEYAGKGADPASEPEPLTQAADCSPYEYIGYLKGEYNADKDRDTDKPIPEECKEIHDQGYESGKNTANKVLAQDMDTRKQSDLTVIGEAIYLYASENNGYLPDGIQKEPLEIGTGEGKLNIIQSLESFITSERFPDSDGTFPFDPEDGTLESTKYTVYQHEDGRVVVEASSSANPGEKLSFIR